MYRHIACVLVTGCALAAQSGSAASAPQPARPAGVDILVGGTPLTEHHHNGRLYVEALKGREYAIRLRNPYDTRVAVALSVDGLNTIDARQSTAHSARKWVLGPRETVVISGWQVSGTAARRFEFTTEERSYGQALGKTANLGVITAVFFRERVATVTGRTRADSARDASEAAAEAPAPQASAPGASRRAAEEYAATGMGRRTDHSVEQVWMDLEDVPAATVNIRYEFRPQLVRLGILPGTAVSPLDRRERAKGFEPGFSPEIPSRR